MTTGAAPDAAVAQEAGAGPEAEGRRAVRLHLVARLEAAGMVRRKGVSEAAHRDWLSRLVERLAYLTRDNLDLLADAMLVLGGGKGRNEWPSEVTILTYAEGLQRRPVAELPLIASWFGSVEGPMALLGGYEVELLRFLRRAGRPPLPYAAQQIRDEAAENARALVRMRERLDAGVESQADRAFLEAYARDKALAAELIARGEAKRAEKGRAA